MGHQDDHRMNHQNMERGSFSRLPLNQDLVLTL